MITELIKIPIQLIADMTNGLEKLHFTVSNGFYEVLDNYLSFAVWILPWRELAPIVIFIFSMFIFRTVVSIIKTIWNLLPIL